ncbi:conserved hypothetical protein [Pantoea brenneri]|uniref:Uncharacterized protein n=1 Tax=Pantoea brenneri TaxID=472694 RepID=A0AAX3J7L3_9GAMM|nr:conserved hypothetical protein [Pantoea brenneri]
MPPLPGHIANVSGKPEDGSLAQLVEQLTFNQLVAGSNPARPTISGQTRVLFACPFRIPLQHCFTT